MTNGEQADSLYAAILNSAATIAIISASLYYVGYLYLLGFYRAFGIPIDSLNLSFEVIAAQSRIVLVPAIVIILFLYFNYKSEKMKLESDICIGPVKVRFRIPYLNFRIPFIRTPDLIGGADFIWEKLKSSKPILIIILLSLILILSLIPPFIGEYMANMKIENFHSGANESDILLWLENPIPRVNVYSSEPLLFIKADQIDKSTKNSTYIYENLMLIASTHRSCYLFSKDYGTYQIPVEKVSLIYPR